MISLVRVVSRTGYIVRFSKGEEECHENERSDWLPFASLDNPTAIRSLLLRGSVWLVGARLLDVVRCGVLEGSMAKTWKTGEWVILACYWVWRPYEGKLHLYFSFLVIYQFMLVVRGRKSTPVQKFLIFEFLIFPFLKVLGSGLYKYFLEFLYLVFENIFDFLNKSIR